MGYSYEKERENIFTEDGVKFLMKVIIAAESLERTKGVVIVDDVQQIVSGDTWDSLACIDYLCEQGMLHELERQPRGFVQDRTFTIMRC